MSDIAFPLSWTEATTHMTVAQRQCTAKTPATSLSWWLRSPGSFAANAQFVSGGAGSFGSLNVSVTGAVRPAL